MFIQLLRAKLHQARVTAADDMVRGSHHVGRYTVDQFGAMQYERVQVVDLENGNRLETYVIRGEPGSGTIQLNGAAAHLVSIGDRVIVMAYATVPLPVAGTWEPRVVVLDERNRIRQWLNEGTACQLLAGTF